MVYSDATAMSLCTFGLTILQHHYDYHVERTVMKRRVAMCHMIYKKGHVRAQGTYNELCSSGLDTAFLLRTDEERERRFLSLGPTVTEQEVITGTAETPKVNPAQQRRGPSHGKARHVSLPLPGLRVGRCRPRGAKQKRRCERDEEKDDTERLTGSRGGRQGEEEREKRRASAADREKRRASAADREKRRPTGRGGERVRPTGRRGERVRRTGRRGEGEVESECGRPGEEEREKWRASAADQEKRRASAADREKR
ncbi:SART-1 family protein DOT2-like isoform X2 [Toxotes jaculatrix]|uniref:SART-1 family protein DOT2-like isoform X2 n=1 Tax=Toxotes jaculatrix TaxID=941984 RepID=UPI001B3AE858|nr:SART-1 family protein DOT2-like isoform X2 [Toxotes jaculatrix]